MTSPRSEEPFLDIPNAKFRVGACIAFIFALIVLTFAQCGQPRGHFQAHNSVKSAIDDPFYWWLKPSISSDRATIPEVFGANLPQSPPDIGPPILCSGRDMNTQKTNDIMIAYQFWMGPGYSTADLTVHLDHRASFEAIIGAHGFPERECQPGMLSETTIREFYELIEKLHVCDDPPRPTWENVGVEPLCVRKGNDVCLIGIGNQDDPRQRLIRLAVARLAIYSCTSRNPGPTGPT